MLLRISNYTVPSRKLWEMKRTLLRKDVSVKKDRAVIKLRWSKTLQHRSQATRIVIAATGDKSCPVKALKRYLHKYKVKRREPLFIFRNGDPVTAAEWRRILKKLQSEASVSAAKSPHSFRRGGAIFYFKLGVPIEEIAKLGTWRSDCIYKYIRNRIPDHTPFAKAFTNRRKSRN